ncbi:MAG: ferrous iron transport protein A [Saprospiraceae bacterium]|nr:ferrous iron transport protein A [Saprospiraceae bacterium]
MEPVLTNNSLTSHHEHEMLKVLEFTDQRLGSRLMSMGVLPGSFLTIERIAPYRGGYCLRINDKKIAIRYREAESIIVE